MDISTELGSHSLHIPVLLFTNCLLNVPGVCVELVYEGRVVLDGLFFN
jgi:hypothetical protein